MAHVRVVLSHSKINFMDITCSTCLNLVSTVNLPIQIKRSLGMESPIHSGLVRLIFYIHEVERILQSINL